MRNIIINKDKLIYEYNKGCSLKKLSEIFNLDSRTIKKKINRIKII